MKNSNLFTIPLTLATLLFSGSALALETEAVTVVPAPAKIQNIEPLNLPHTPPKAFDPEGVDPKELKMEITKLLTGAAKHSAVGTLLKDISKGDSLGEADLAKLNDVLKNVLMELKPASLKPDAGGKQPGQKPAAKTE